MKIARAPESDNVDDQMPRRKPRTFTWPRSASQAVLANLNASGPELRKLITTISEQTGNPRDACLRFARGLGVKAKQGYRRWTNREQKQLENGLEVHRVRRVATQLGRTPAQVYGMMHRLGISGKRKLTGKLSMYALARLLHKHPQVVRQWILSGVLESENEGTKQVPRWMISRRSLQRFIKEHRQIFTAGHLDRERSHFIWRYVFPAKRAASLRKRRRTAQPARRRRKKGATAKPTQSRMR